MDAAIFESDQFAGFLFLLLQSRASPKGKAEILRPSSIDVEFNA
jgi:hypothetical protein